MVWPCTCAWQGHARARGNATRMRVATNRAGILLANMRPGQLKKKTLNGHFSRPVQTDPYIYVFECSFPFQCQNKKIAQLIRSFLILKFLNAVLVGFHFFHFVTENREWPFKRQPYLSFSFLGDDC